MPGTGDIVELIDIVRQSAAGAGRDPEAIEITYGNTALAGPDGGEEAAKLAEAGVDRCFVPSYLFLGETEATLAAHAERVIAPLA